MSLFDTDDELRLADLLRPVPARRISLVGGLCAVIGAGASSAGVVSLIRADYAVGWGITMVALGLPIAVLGVQLLLYRRWPLRPTAPWALAALALWFVGFGVAAVLLERHWRGAATCSFVALALGYVAWRRGRRMPPN
jgi:hypothetical protein